MPRAARRPTASGREKRAPLPWLVSREREYPEARRKSAPPQVVVGEDGAWEDAAGEVGLAQVALVEGAAGEVAAVEVKLLQVQAVKHIVVQHALGEGLEGKKAQVPLPGVQQGGPLHPGEGAVLEGVIQAGHVFVVQPGKGAVHKLAAGDLEVLQGDLLETAAGEQAVLHHAGGKGIALQAQVGKGLSVKVHGCASYGRQLPRFFQYSTEPVPWQGAGGFGRRQVNGLPHPAPVSSPPPQSGRRRCGNCRWTGSGAGRRIPR